MRSRPIHYVLEDLKKLSKKNLKQIVFVYGLPSMQDRLSRLALIGIALIAFGAYYLHTNYDFELRMDFTDNYQMYGTRKTFNLLESETNNNSLDFVMDYTYTTTDDFYQNRIFFGFTGTFD